MARSIASLAVSLTARTSKFNKKMARASKTIKKLGADVAAMSIKMAKFGAATATVAVGAITLLTKQSFALIDTLAKVANRFGTTTKELQNMRFAAKQSGLEVRTFDMAMQRLQRRAAEAAIGTGEAQAAIKELGLDAKKFSALGLENKVLKLAKAFEKLSDPGERLRLAFKLFDSEGAAVIQLLNKGGDGIRKLIRDSERFGGVITNVQARLVENANDAVDRTARAFRAIFNNFAVAISPMVDAVASSMANFLADIRSTDTVMQGFVTNAFFGLGKLIDMFRQLRIELLGVAKAINVEIVRALEFFVGKTGNALILKLPFIGKFAPGALSDAVIEKSIENIHILEKSMASLQLELDRNPASLKFLRTIEDIIKRTKDAASGGPSLPKFLDSLSGLTAGPARQTQFRQIQFKSGFAAPPGTKSRPQIINAPATDALLKKLIQLNTFTRVAGAVAG